MRFDDNYSLWKDSAVTFYKNIKYRPLSEKRRMTLSIGGEARMEYADFHNEDWGRKRLGHNNFLLLRYGIYADIHLGNRFRFFMHWRSALETGRKDGPRSIDEDKLNIQNLFADVVILNKIKRSLMLRIGRQELNYGSGRLISVRDGPNLRLYFTGLKLLYSSSHFNADAFVMVSDIVSTGILDNKLKKIQDFGEFIPPMF
ncbi:MAG: alginate export family protein [Sporocytophaga sp.]|uniref:alginate export family protein n=1 Tax=Sporocytophaga sp. TaxID=2231183 RepID=UPI001B0405F8|nr:alginate export family protein [Sporocytophaga sp.]MBO9701873.1 alginate export family protein [Sporocytophaga sp.]